MPTSAAGNRRLLPPLFLIRGRAARAAGFTLVELLVVMAIIGLAMAGVAFAMRDTSHAVLDREAERLAALFEAARAQSRASGVAVRWRLTEQGGFVFDGTDENALPTQWMSAGIRVQEVTANGLRANAIQLGPEPIIAAQRVVLASDNVPGRSLQVATDGLRPFSVSTP
ncbi:MAG: prepilin-type N-terminal cleavage/methylation domain-containing protein [Proteobacteria bacterium]|nr:prepilin-type N-terminal cleavage/methylation domain-containing protein [Pseudomonadota bacterium]